LAGRLGSQLVRAPGPHPCRCPGPPRGRPPTARTAARAAGTLPAQMRSATPPGAALEFRNRVPYPHGTLSFRTRTATRRWQRHSTGRAQHDGPCMQLPDQVIPRRLLHAMRGCGPAHQPHHLQRLAALVRARRPCEAALRGRRLIRARGPCSRRRTPCPLLVRGTREDVLMPSSQPVEIRQSGSATSAAGAQSDTRRPQVTRAMHGHGQMRDCVSFHKGPGLIRGAPASARPGPSGRSAPLPRGSCRICTAWPPTWNRRVSRLWSAPAPATR